MNPLLTIKQLSELLQIPKTTIYQYVHEDYIPYVKVGGHLRFNQRTIEIWLAKRTHVGRRTRRVEIG